jgi:hypothetical protein
MVTRTARLGVMLGQMARVTLSQRRLAEQPFKLRAGHPGLRVRCPGSRRGRGCRRSHGGSTCQCTVLVIWYAATPAQARPATVTAVAGDRDRLVRRDGGGPGPVTCELAVSVNAGANAGADEPEDYGKEQVTGRPAGGPAGAGLVLNVLPA